MSTWKKSWDYPLPDPNAPGVEEADFMLAFCVRSLLNGASFNFLAKDLEPEFANPQAFLENIITYAVSLTQNNFTRKYASIKWNPVSAGFREANKGIEWMKQMAVNEGDPNSVSVYEAWINGTGQLYGGHAPVPTFNGDGYNTSTGQSAAPPGTVL